MNPGDSVTDAVGPKAEVVGNTQSDFFKGINAYMLGNIQLTVGQDLSGARPMMAGMSLAEAAGTSAEVYGKGALTGVAMGLLAEGGVEAMQMNATAPSTPSVQQQVAPVQAPVRQTASVYTKPPKMG